MGLCIPQVIPSHLTTPPPLQGNGMGASPSHLITEHQGVKDPMSGSSVPSPRWSASITMLLIPGPDSWALEHAR